MTNKEFLTWLHERLFNVHGENLDEDYMIRLRAVIKSQDDNQTRQTMNTPATPSRPLPWKPFAPVPLDDADAELKGSHYDPAVRAIMEHLESEIASAADLSGAKDLSRAAGRFEALLDFHQLITGKVRHTP